VSVSLGPLALAGILKRLGRRPGLLAGAATIAAQLADHPTPASSHLSEQDEEVASAAIPCREQGGSRGIPEGLWLLPCRLSRGCREAQGWRPPGEIPERLLSPRAAIRPSVGDRAAAADNRRRKRHPKSLQGWATPGREKCVRMSRRSSELPGGRPHPGRFYLANGVKSRAQDAAPPDLREAKRRFAGFSLYTRQEPILVNVCALRPPGAS
jgi:hypothetical protein